MNWYKTSKLNKEMPKRRLGKTGYQVSIFSLGGQGTLEEYEGRKSSLEIIRRAYELGINYFDTSPIYGDSEVYYGEALKDIRKDIFLASKTDDRTKDGSLRLLERSLKRLNTDYLDLWQIHHLDDSDEVLEVSKKNGALQALIEMKEQKVVRFLGFTGHQNPDILVEMSEKHPFDTVLFPVNAADKNMKKSFISELLPVVKKQGLGTIGMKVFSHGYMLHPKGIKTPWEAIAYALSQDISTIIVGHDSVEQLEENVAIAKGFYGLSEEQQKEIAKKTKDYLKRSCFFRKEYGGYDSKEKLEPPYVIGKTK